MKCSFTPTFATLVLVLVLGLAGCETGPKYYEVDHRIPPLAAGEGRIFFYRQMDYIAAIVESPIWINGVEVGRSKAGTFFFVDRPAGVYDIMCRTEVPRWLTLQLRPGDVAHVNTRIEQGVWISRITPVLQSARLGHELMFSTEYIGPPGLLEPESESEAGPEPRSSPAPEWAESGVETVPLEHRIGRGTPRGTDVSSS